MKVLYYCLHRPGELKGKLSGPTRSARATVVALESVGMEVTIVDRDEYRDEEAVKLEKKVDVIHCNNADILTAMLKRSVVPEVIGAHPFAPSKYYRPLKGYYRYPGYEDNPDRLYDDAIWARNNFQEERFKPELLKKIRVVQPCIEVDEIYPPRGVPFSNRRYILWAGGQKRIEKNWPLMEQIMRAFTLPPPFEWKILPDYAIDEYLEVLDQTALMLFTSKYESFGFQLFEAWAKAVPTIYQSTLWGNIPFSGCGGFPLRPGDYSVDGFCDKLEEFFSLDSSQREQGGMASREGVVRDFTPRRMGRELELIYTQALEAKKPAG